MADDTLPGPPAGRPTELQQLEAALAAGVITPELFATLRAKLAPAAPAAVPPASRPAPAAPSEELPSLLEMFGNAPGPVVSAPGPPATPPAPASPARPAATAPDDAAARRRIEEHLAKLRQEEQAAKLRQAAPIVLPPPPAPTFYPEQKPTPAPTFYPKPEPPTPPARPPVASPPEPPPRRPAPAPAERSRSWLPLLLVLLLAVVGGLAYYFTSTSHPDEELSSSQPAASEPAPAAVPKPVKPKRAKAAKRAKAKKKVAKAPAVTAAVSDSAETSDVVENPSAAPATAPMRPTKAAVEPTASQPIAAAGEAGDDAATTKVRETMASYYADLYAPPLHASQHFAPQVERLYIRQNLTPAAIEAELARSFFPDNQQAVCRIEPGTLRVSSPAADGSRTATFTEMMRLYRVSLQKYQRLRTQVRVRFNSAYQIVYMRQEKLLANAFEE